MCVIHPKMGLCSFYDVSLLTRTIDYRYQPVATCEQECVNVSTQNSARSVAFRKAGIYLRRVCGPAIPRSSARAVLLAVGLPRKQ